jgi:hypothetical protein
MNDIGMVVAQGSGDAVALGDVCCHFTRHALVSQPPKAQTREESPSRIHVDSASSQTGLESAFLRGSWDEWLDRWRWLAPSWPAFANDQAKLDLGNKWSGVLRACSGRDTLRASHQHVSFCCHVDQTCSIRHKDDGAMSWYKPGLLGDDLGLVVDNTLRTILIPKYHRTFLIL